LKPHHFHPAAAKDYTAAVAYYAKIDPAIDAIEDAPLLKVQINPNGQSRRTLGDDRENHRATFWFVFIV
jgi:hypothetical protein